MKSDGKNNMRIRLVTLFVQRERINGGDFSVDRNEIASELKFVKRIKRPFNSLC